MKTIEKVNGIIDVLNKFINLVNDNGPIKLLKSCITFSLCFCIIYVTFNPDVVIKRVEEYRDKIHKEQIQRALMNDKLISEVLREITITSHADRAFIITLHNSVKGLGNIPFAFGTMNYEELNPSFDVLPISDGFADFHTGKYPLLSYLCDGKIFAGTLDELKEIDVKLYHKLKGENIDYLVCVAIMGDDLPLGVLSITYSNNNENRKMLGNYNVSEYLQHYTGYFKDKLQ